VLKITDAGDRCEVTHRIVTDLLQQAGIGAMGLIAAEQQHVAVGLGAGDVTGADRRGPTGHVLDDNGPALTHR
jgi:hypothetical protein